MRAALLALTFLLAGCGAAGGGSIAGTPGTSGPVTVTADQSTYFAGQMIGAAVHNGLGAPIYAFDTRSGCSILDLQIESQGQWTTSNEARCPMGRVARRVAIAPGGDYTTRIAAYRFGLTTQPLSPGTYRLALTYQLTAQFTAQFTTQLMPSTTVTAGTAATSVTTVYSSSFVILATAR